MRGERGFAKAEVAPVTTSFYPTAGQVALVEPDIGGHVDHDAANRMIGMVTGSDGTVTIVGLASSHLADGADVLVSIFTSDALYRLRATSHWDGVGRLTVGPIHDTERIQRRQWPRHPLHFDITLAPLDDDSDATGIHGQTLDLSVGGLRVATSRQLPAGSDVTVIMTLPDGILLVARTTVVYAYVNGDVFEYRLAFDHLDDVDASRLTALVGAASTIDVSPEP